MITKTVSTSMRIAISCAQLCSKTTVVLKNQEVIDIERENKKREKPNEATSVENKNKNHHSFLEMSPIQQEVPLLHKVGGHAYELDNSF